MLDGALHVGAVAELLAAFLSAVDATSLLLWALDAHALADGARLLVTRARIAFDATDVLHAAAAYGCRRIVQRLLRSSCATAAGDDATASSWVDAYRCALQRTAHVDEPIAYTFPGPVIYEAAKRGDLVTVQWLHGISDYLPHEAMACAGDNGHVAVALWLGDARASARLPVNVDPKTQYELAVRHLTLSVDGVEDVAVLAWMVKFANSNKDVEHISYLLTRHGLFEERNSDTQCGNFTGSMVDTIAGLGDLALLRALLDDGAFEWTCSVAAITRAAANGHLHVLEWLHEHRQLACTADAVDVAALNGHLHCLRWLVKRYDEPLDARTMHAAARGGHINVLEWIHSEARHIKPSCTLLEAACVPPNRLQVLQWLEDNKAYRTVTNHAMAEVLGHGDAVTARWLADPVGDGANLEHWDSVVARWMSYEFALWQHDTVSRAALNGHVAIVNWLGSGGSFHRVERDALWQCAMLGHMSVVEAVLQNPKYQPKSLRFLPSHWTSFASPYDARVARAEMLVKRRRLGERVEWHALSYDPPWARTYVLLWLRYRLDECLSVAWLPLWAVHCRHFDILEHLADVDPPSVARLLQQQPRTSARVALSARA